MTPIPGVEAAAHRLEAHGLRKAYGSRTVVDGVRLSVMSGEVVGLLGPNGAGKTTTMRMLTGNLAPSTGSISICGIDLLERPTATRLTFSAAEI